MVRIVLRERADQRADACAYGRAFAGLAAVVPYDRPGHSAQHTACHRGMLHSCTAKDHHQQTG
jgi:hypothetical protein